MVLAGDGRVVTALDRVQGVRDLRVVYPDGRVVRARVSAIDAAWGLAVLDGTGARWPEGIELAERDGRSGDAASWIPAGGARPVAGTLARRRSFVGADGVLLRDAWEISPVAPRSAVGAGVVHVRTATLLGVLVAPAGDVTTTGAEAGTGYLPLAPLSNATLQVRVAGTATAALTLPGVSIPATVSRGTAVSIFAIGVPGATGAQRLSALVCNDRVPAASVLGTCSRLP